MMGMHVTGVRSAGDFFVLPYHSIRSIEDCVFRARQQAAVAARSNTSTADEGTQ